MKTNAKRLGCLIGVVLLNIFVAAGLAYQTDKELVERVTKGQADIGLGEGFVDQLEIEDGYLRSSGWVKSFRTGVGVSSILVTINDRVLSECGSDRHDRPDVARAKNDPEWLGTGWRLQAAVDETQARNAENAMFYAVLSDGSAFELKRSSSAAGRRGPAQAVGFAPTIPALYQAMLVAAAFGLAAATACAIRPCLDGPSLSVLSTGCGVLFLILASKLQLIGNFGSSVPFWDQWDAQALNLYIPFLNGELSLDHILSAHNEHRIVLTRLLNLALLTVNQQWDPIVEMSAQAVIHSVALATLIILFRDSFSQRAWHWIALYLTTVYCLPFSWENTLWGFQSQFYLSFWLGLLGIYFVIKASPLSHQWILGYALLVLGLFSMASGVLAPLAALLVNAIRQLADRSWPACRALTASILICLLVVAGFALRVEVPRLAGLKATTAMEFLSFLAVLMSWPIPYTAFGILVYLPPVALVCYCILLRNSSARKPWFLVCCVVWLAANIAAIAYGRANHGMAPRYADTLVFGVIISILSSLYLAERSSRLVKKVLMAYTVCVASAAFAGLLHNSEVSYKEISRRKSFENIQIRNIQDYITNRNPTALRGKENLQIPYPDSALLEKVLSDTALLSMLPTSLQLPLSPSLVGFSGDAFVENAGLYPTTVPLGTANTFYGSYGSEGDLSQGRLRLEFATIPGPKFLELLVSGYPLAAGVDVSFGPLDEAPSLLKGISHAGEEWTRVRVGNPREPFGIYIHDASPNAWLAVSLPKPIGLLSVWSRKLLSSWWLIAGFGVGLLSWGWLSRMRSFRLNQVNMNMPLEASKND